MITKEKVNKEIDLLSENAPDANPSLTQNTGY